jgi:hypothetical protein
MKSSSENASEEPPPVRETGAIALVPIVAEEKDGWASKIIGGRPVAHCSARAEACEEVKILASRIRWRLQG